jgi:hypothetical protein
MGQHWTVRCVVAHKHRDLIDDWIFRHNGVRPGNRQYLGVYQTALSAAVDELQMDEMVKLQETADRWNENGPPPEVKKL